MLSTNYFSLFIEVAEDCGSTNGVVPPTKADKKTVANYEYEIISENPYKYTSDDVIFLVYAIRNNIPESNFVNERELYFSKGRPCFRASPLTKTYGWGLHSDEDGRIALYGVESTEYSAFVADVSLKKKKAMRSKKK